MFEIGIFLIIIFIIAYLILLYLESNLFCKHSWERPSFYVTESEFEQVKRLGYNPNTHNSCTKYYITDYKCTKCGKLKRFTRKI